MLDYESFDDSKEQCIRVEGEDAPFSQIFNDFGLGIWEPQMVPDKATADRYRIERSSDHRVLCPRRAFGAKFEPFGNSRILALGKAIFDRNKSLTITKATSTGFGEKLVVMAKINQLQQASSITGIGEVTPNMVMLFNVASTSVKIGLTYYQLFCDNQIPSLVNDPLSRVLSLDKDATDEMLMESSGNLNDYLYDNVERMMGLLSLLGNTLVSTRSIITLFAVTFGVYDIEEERPNLFKSLMECYESAPNAAPGTLLGGLNAITHYYTLVDHKTRRSARMADLPSSGQNVRVRKAMRLLGEAAKFDNADRYFDVLV